jgi:hypothetical protein
MFHRCKTLADADKLLDQIHQVIPPHHEYLRELLDECYLDFKAFGNPERIPKAEPPSPEPERGRAVEPTPVRISKGDPRLEIIPRLKARGAAIGGSFDLSFVLSVETQLEAKGSVSEKQYNALVSTEGMLFRIS